MIKKIKYLIILFFLFGCKEDQITVVFDATDTIDRTGNYKARIFIQDKPEKFIINGFYFWDKEMYRNGDTGVLLFKTNCPPDSILRAKNPKAFEKKYQILIKGTYDSKDSVIEIMRSYYMNCE